MSIFSGLFKSRDKPKDSYDSPSYSYFFGRTHSGKRVNDRTALQHIIVYACVRVLSETIAQLPPDKVKVDRDDKNRLVYIYSRYDEANPNMKVQGDIVLRAEDVLHIPGLGFDGLVGYSPIALAKNAIGISLACEEYGSAFFANGAIPSGVLEHPGVIKDPGRVRNAWQRAYGSGNAHKTAILEEGMKYTPISIPNNEAQFLETRKFQIEEIARLYRVPLNMIGDLEHATFSNIEQQSLEFVKYTLDPWIVRWEQSLQKALLGESEKGEYFIKFNVEPVTRRLRKQNAGLQHSTSERLDVGK